MGTSKLFNLNQHDIFIKAMIKSMYHLIFLRKHELNAVSLTITYSFPPFEFSTPHFKVSEVLIIPSFVLFTEYLTLQVV